MYASIHVSNNYSKISNNCNKFNKIIVTIIHLVVKRDFLKITIFLKKRAKKP
jgi:hypothetical protein